MVRRAAWIGLAAWGCAASPAVTVGPPPSAVQPGDLAIAGVTVVPMVRDGVLPHHTVVIRGDRIVAVAATASLALPAGVRVIDGAGKWLMPGLADMHVHAWSEDDLTMFVAAGVTTIRNMWGTALQLGWRSEIARGARLGPTIVTAGGLIDGDPPDWPGSLVLASAADAEPLVVAQQAAGFDFLKPLARLSREAYEALAAAGARHGMPLAGHVALAEGLDGVLAARQRSIEHLDGYLAALVPPGPPLPSVDDLLPWLRAVLARRDRARLAGLIARTKAAGTWNCPTLIANDRIAEISSVAALQARVRWLALVPAAVRAKWARDFAARHASDEDAATLRAANAQLAQIAGALAAADAPILVGTDTGAPYVVPGEALHAELELLVAAGVPRPRVLRAATADAWRFLERPGEAGVVAVGARADLLLIATDPLTAPLPLIPAGVVLRGRWLPRAELEARLTQLADPPADRWAGAPPLDPDGALVRRAGYDHAIAGTRAGQERVVVSSAAGQRVIRGELADFASRTETSYQLGPSTVALTFTYHTMTLALRAELAGDRLVVTGRDLVGKPVALSAPAPLGAVLIGPGGGGAIPLIAQLAGLPPGGRRTVTALELRPFPAIAIVATDYAVERKPDRGGHRLFAIVAGRPGPPATSQLVVDGDGLVVDQLVAPPVSTRVTRRP